MPTKIGGLPSCNWCHGLLIGIDSNVCPSCSVRFCSLCHGGYYTIDPVTKIQAKKCSSCGDSSSDDDATKQTHCNASTINRTYRHIFAEDRRRQQDELFEKHKSQAEAEGGTGQNGPNQSSRPKRKGVAALIKRKRPKPTYLNLEASGSDAEVYDPDKDLDFWEGTEDENEVTVDPNSQYNGLLREKPVVHSEERTKGRPQEPKDKAISKPTRSTRSSMQPLQPNPLAMNRTPGAFKLGGSIQSGDIGRSMDFFDRRSTLRSATTRNAQMHGSTKKKR